LSISAGRSRLVRSWARQWHRQFARHPYQLSERFGLHLAHDAAAVNLQRCLADAELRSSLLVEQTADDERKHFSPARREAVVALPESHSLQSFGAPVRVQCDGGLDRGQ